LKAFAAVSRLCGFPLVYMAGIHGAMKPVPGINYLYRRGAVYVFYRRVPKDLVGKPDITRPDKKPLGKFLK
jgi:hypothetical protein